MIIPVISNTVYWNKSFLNPIIIYIIYMVFFYLFNISTGDRYNKIKKYNYFFSAFLFSFSFFLFFWFFSSLFSLSLFFSLFFGFWFTK